MIEQTSWTTEELVSRWEDRRAIKNLMGKYAYCFLIKREASIFPDFWSRRADVSLGLNEGYYVGPEAVAGYYSFLAEKAAAAEAAIRRAFPEETKEAGPDFQGLGELEYVALSTPVIVRAEADDTAKGVWYDHGARAEVGPAGPVSHWVWRSYAVDFVKEDGAWKIWHMLVSEDVNHPCGEDWTQPKKARAEIEAFAPLKELCPPSPTHPCAVRSLYHPNRPPAPLPQPPVPYDCFENTFSYGWKEEAACR